MLVVSISNYLAHKKYYKLLLITLLKTSVVLLRSTKGNFNLLKIAN